MISFYLFGANKSIELFCSSQMLRMQCWWRCRAWPGPGGDVDEKSRNFNDEPRASVCRSQRAHPPSVSHAPPQIHDVFSSAFVSRQQSLRNSLFSDQRVGVAWNFWQWQPIHRLNRERKHRATSHKSHDKGCLLRVYAMPLSCCLFHFTSDGEITKSSRWVCPSMLHYFWV